MARARVHAGWGDRGEGAGGSWWELELSWIELVLELGLDRRT